MIDPGIDIRNFDDRRSGSLVETDNSVWSDNGYGDPPADVAVRKKSGSNI